MFNQRISFIIFIFCFYCSLIHLSSIAAQIKKDKPSSAIPYEKCNKENSLFTNRIVSDSQVFSNPNMEAKSLCLKCELESHGVGIGMLWLKKFMQKDKTQQSNNIPESCFLSSMLKSAKGSIWRPWEKNYYHCSSRQADKPVPIIKYDCLLGKCTAKPQRPCLNQNYVQMTTKAFNETANCFGYTSKKDKEKLFALMNHESSFILNKRAAPIKGQENEARCYGQIKHAVITDIGRWMHYGQSNKYWKKYHQIAQDVSTQCPQLYKKVANNNNCLNSRNVETFRKCMKSAHSKNKAICHTSQDAYSCLFYTMYNTKRNEIAYHNHIKFYAQQEQKNIQDLLDSVNKENIPLVQKKQKIKKLKQMAKDFKWPIKLNEIAIFEGSIVAPNGTQRKKNYFFYNIKQMYELLSNMNYHSTKWEVKKNKLFNEDELKWTFLYLAHNGGISLIQEHFPEFIRHIKTHRINLTKKSHRENLKKSRTIKMHVLAKEIKNYIAVYHKEHPDGRKIYRAKELASFITKVNRDIKHVRDPYIINNRVSNLTTQARLKVADMSNFTKEVGRICPKPIF